MSESRDALNRSSTRSPSNKNEEAYELYKKSKSEPVYLQKFELSLAPFLPFFLPLLTIDVHRKILHLPPCHLGAHRGRCRSWIKIKRNQ